MSGTAARDYSSILIIDSLEFISRRANLFNFVAHRKKLGFGLKFKYCGDYKSMCRSFLVWTEGVSNAASAQDSSSPFIVKRNAS